MYSESLKFKLNEGLKSHCDLSVFQNVGLSLHVKTGPFLRGCQVSLM